MIRVAIFEDNKHLRDTFQFLLETAEGFTCTGAYSNCDGLPDELAVHPCDVVLMDIEMPGMNGIEATQLIKSSFPDINILIQTVFFNDNFIFDAICAGASGYILKSTTTDGYLQAIRDVHAGGSPITPTIAGKVIEFFKKNLPAPLPSNKYNLTAQEKKVLQLLSVGKSYKMIAAELYVAPIQ